MRLQSHLETINDSCFEMVNLVRKRSSKWLDEGKIVGVLGGDHSTALGLIEELAERFGSFGILQIDAHMDLREAYEGFIFSHASIMFNAVKSKNIEKLVQVGVRDFCEEEVHRQKDSNGRIRTHFMQALKEGSFTGITFEDQVLKIIKDLPEKVYVSFDIDGLDPSLCPNTGTPVPGGLQYHEARYILKKVALSGRKIIGFDLCEVAPSSYEKNEWDPNVGARVLYDLVNFTGISQGLLQWKS